MQGCQQTIKYLSSNRLVKADTPSHNCLQVFKILKSNLGYKIIQISHDPPRKSLQIIKTFILKYSLCPSY